MTESISQHLELRLQRLRRSGAAVDTLWRAGQLGASWALVREQLAEVAGAEVELDALASSERAHGDLIGISRQLKALAAEMAAADEPEQRLSSDHRAALLLRAAPLLDVFRRRLSDGLHPARRRLRWAAGALLLAGFALLSIRLLNATRVRASATYSNAFVAQQALDNDDSTEWLLPDGELGWWELRFPRARSVSHVRLYNARNLPYKDRATRAFHIQLLDERHRLAEEKGQFSPIAEDKPAVDVDISSSGVTRLRVYIDSYYKRGGGLAEVDVR